MVEPCLALTRITRSVATSIYDFLHHVVNTKFVNFQDNATRKSGAISYLLYTSFGISSNNSVEKVTFENAKPVYFPPMENKWSNDDYGNESYKTAVFHDKDGTVSGVANSYILSTDAANGVAIDKACQVKRTWNAAVCKGDYGRMSFAAPRPAAGAGQGAGGPGAGAGRRARVVASTSSDDLRVARLRSRQLFSAAKARISPSTGQPTCERAWSSRWQPKGQP